MNHFDNDPGRQFFALMQQSGLVQFSILYASDDYHSEQATKLFNLGVAAGFDVSICSAPLDIADPYSAVRASPRGISCYDLPELCLCRRRVSVGESCDLLAALCFWHAPFPPSLARVHLSMSLRDMSVPVSQSHTSLSLVLFLIYSPRQANNATIDRWTTLLKVNAVAIIVILTGPTQAEVAAYKLDQGGVRLGLALFIV